MNAEEFLEFVDNFPEKLSSFEIILEYFILN